MKLSLIAALLFASVAQAAPVTIKFTNTGRQAGVIRIAIFNNARFFPDNASGIIKKADLAVGRSQTTAETTLDLPEGDYAISVFLDENNNRKLDTNFMGIPKERFGFSGNPTVRFGAPSYSQCEVRVEETGSVVAINLKKFL